MKNKKKNNNETFVKFNNDQLGENASEEFRSENYSNTEKSSHNKKKNK